MQYWVQTESETFQLRDGENLLDALQRTGHNVDYQCRSGYCGSCRCRLARGAVSYEVAPLAYVSQDEILPCCAVVTSDIELAVTVATTVKE